MLYRDGRGVARDDAEAVRWFRRAAEQGHNDGQNNLGRMYSNGRGVRRDRVEVVGWYRRAAEQGDAGGQMGPTGSVHAMRRFQRWHGLDQHRPVDVAAQLGDLGRHFSRGDMLTDHVDSSSVKSELSTS